MNKLEYYKERARLAALTASSLPCKLKNAETKKAFYVWFTFHVKNKDGCDLDYYKECCKLAEAVVHIAPCKTKSDIGVKKNFNQWQSFVFANKQWR